MTIHQRALAGARKPIRVPGLLPGLARAEAAPTIVDIMDIVKALNATFAAFKAQNDAEMAELKKRGAVDPVTAEHTAKINAEVARLTAQLDDMNTRLAASRAGGTTTQGAVTPEVKAYNEAFNRWFTRGENENGLHALAVRAAMTTDSNPDGGYLVPVDIEKEITRVLALRSAMRGLARVITISTDTYKKPHNLAGTDSGWVGERDTRTATNNPTLAELEFPVHEIYAMPKATQKVLDDAYINLADWLAQEVQIQFAEAEGLAFISGSGVKKPRGFTAYSTVANASYAWGKIGYIASGVAAALFDSSNNGVDALMGMVYGLRAGYRANATWIMNDATTLAVRKLKDQYGDYLWQPPVQAGQPASLVGYSVAPDDQMPDIGAGNFPIAFGDWSRGYLIVDRAGISVLRDPYSSKPYVLFYTTKRVGGGVMDFAAIKLMKIATS